MTSHSSGRKAGSAPRRILCETLPRPGQEVPLPEAEARHLTHSLRLSDGDLVEAIDGEGHSVIAALVRAHSGWALRFERNREQNDLPDESPRAHLITLELAVLKGDSMSWAIEKAVELGVDELQPLTATRCVVRTKDKGAAAFLERWTRIADQALKQCGRLTRMKVLAPKDVASLVAPDASETRFYCDEGAASAPGVPTLREALRDLTSQAPRGRILITIGPEGGWTEQEKTLLSRVARRVSLGPWILRSETAALYAASIARD